MYNVVDETGKVLGSGPSEKIAIAAAVANMPAGAKAHCADMGVTPLSVIENFLENEDYQVVEV